MRLITIDISGLVNVREVLQLKRIVCHVLFFTVLAGLWAMAFVQPQNPAFYVVLLYLLIPSIILAPPLVFITSRERIISRLIFFFILVMNGISFLILSALIVGLWISKKDNLILIFLSLTVMYILTAAKYINRLFFSFVPFGRKRNVKRELSFSLRFWSGERGEFEDNKSERHEEAGSKIPTRGRNYRLVLSVIAFILALIFLFVTLVTAFDPAFAYSVYSMKFSNAWRIIMNLPKKEPYDPQAHSLGFEILGTLIPLSIAGFWLFIFGFFQNQRRRENVSMSGSLLSQDIRPSDILLLRSFKDDIKAVNKQINPFILLFKFYPWNYTLEQLIVDRMKKIGRIHLLDTQKENERLLEKSFIKIFVYLFGRKRVINFLELHCPVIWRKIPPLGGVRHYMPNATEKEWQAEIKKAMPAARMQIVLLGETDYLRWEMDRINEMKLLGKAFFLMPPLNLPRHAINRWKQFTPYLSEIGSYDIDLLQKVNPRRILAVCVRENDLICVTGKGFNHLFYESAIDIATIVTLLDKPDSDLFLSAYKSI